MSCAADPRRKGGTELLQLTQQKFVLQNVSLALRLPPAYTAHEPGDLMRKLICRTLGFHETKDKYHRCVSQPEVTNES
jgi:hypothetical protein